MGGGAHGARLRICVAAPLLAFAPQDDFGGAEELPEAVMALGQLPLAALAALVLHLRRMRAVDELAGYAALVSPFEVQLEFATVLCLFLP